MSAVVRPKPPVPEVSSNLDLLEAYACPLCGELPRGCACLRPSVRDRIANAIHWPAPPPPLPEPPFLVLRRPRRDRGDGPLGNAA